MEPNYSSCKVTAPLFLVFVIIRVAEEANYSSITVTAPLFLVFVIIRVAEEVRQIGIKSIVKTSIVYSVED